MSAFTGGVGSERMKAKRLKDFIILILVIFGNYFLVLEDALSKLFNDSMNNQNSCVFSFFLHSS